MKKFIFDLPDMFSANNCSTSSMPLLQPCHLTTPPDALISFHEVVRSNYTPNYTTTSTTAIHFYIADRLFLRFFRCIDCYLQQLQSFTYIIMPDLSQYLDMPKLVRMQNNWRNKFAAYYLQAHGFTVIPNVTWSTPDSYDYAFTGIPTHSVIAINSNGAQTDPLTRYLWQKGYDNAVQQLQPSLILRYGPQMPNEHSDISTYYPNPYITRLRTMSHKHKKPNHTIDGVQTQLDFNEPIKGCSKNCF